jgi:hypothetical protein
VDKVLAIVATHPESMRASQPRHDKGHGFVSYGSCYLVNEKTKRGHAILATALRFDLNDITEETMAGMVADAITTKKPVATAGPTPPEQSASGAHETFALSPAPTKPPAKKRPRRRKAER